MSLASPHGVYPIYICDIIFCVSVCKIIGWHGHRGERSGVGMMKRTNILIVMSGHNVMCDYTEL
jgi:hypothetical protein